MIIFLKVFYKFFGAFILILPRKIQLSLGTFLGWIWYGLFKIRKDVIMSNLEIAFPEKSLDWKENVGRKSCDNMGQILIEYLVMANFKNSMLDKYFVIEGRENLENLNQKKKGTFLLSLHLGNGDFGCMAYSRSGIPIRLISKKFKSKLLNDFWFWLRERHGTQFISEEKSSFEILKGIKKGENIIFVLDQYMGPPVGIKTNFFGKPTGTAAGLALFALRTKALVLPTYSYRRSDGRIQCVICPPLDLDYSKEGDEGIREITQCFNNEIEDIIKEHPEQWMWVHRRWKDFG